MKTSEIKEKLRNTFSMMDPGILPETCNYMSSLLKDIDHDPVTPYEIAGDECLAL